MRRYVSFLYSGLLATCIGCQAVKYGEAKMPVVAPIVKTIEPQKNAIKLDLKQHTFNDTARDLKPSETPSTNKFDLSHDHYWTTSRAPPIRLQPYTFDLLTQKHRWLLADDDFFKPAFSEKRATNQFGAQELKITLQATREIVREMAREYQPIQKLERVIRDIERIGERVQNIERGIQAIWTIDLSNIENDLTDPFGPLLHALEKPYLKTERPALTGIIEPTLNGYPIGTRAGQDLMALLQGKQKADVGIKLSIQLYF